MNDTGIISDIQMIIDEGLVDMEVYSDITYIDLYQIGQIFPQLQKSISLYLRKMGYGVYDIYDGGKEYHVGYNKHFTHGPAATYRHGTKEWFVDGRIVASNLSGHLAIFNQDQWKKYFKK